MQQKNETESDLINSPAHYTGVVCRVSLQDPQGGWIRTGAAVAEIECIDLIEALLTREQFIGYLRGAIIKYQWRSEKKGTRSQDHAKAAWYAERLAQFTRDTEGAGTDTRNTA